MNKAVFFDRDGTINKEVDHLYTTKQLQILPHVATTIRELNRCGFLVVVITNQSVIAQGLTTERGVDQIHTALIKRLKQRGAKIDGVYYCPHHPEAAVKKYRLRCRCRKPGTDLIKQASRERQIDLKRSFFVGDMTADILLGERSGLTTILVATGHAGKDGRYNVRPDYRARDLRHALTIIKRSL